MISKNRYRLLNPATDMIHLLPHGGMSFYVCFLFSVNQWLEKYADKRVITIPKAKQFLLFFQQLTFFFNI